jgi:hypothetical protein
MNVDFIGFRQSVADFAQQAGFLFSAIQRGSYDADQREALLAELGTTSATIRNTIVGIDVLIRPVAGTPPGKWTSDLLRLTAEISEDLTLFARNTSSPLDMCGYAGWAICPDPERTRQNLIELEMKVKFLDYFDISAVIPNINDIDAKTVEQNGKLADAIADSSHTKTAEVDKKGGKARSSKKRGRKRATDEQVAEACEVWIEYQKSGMSVKDFCDRWNGDKKVGRVGPKWLDAKLALVRKLLRESPERIPKRFANKLKPLRRVNRAF